MDGGPSLQISTFPSLAVKTFREVEIHRFLFVTWLYVATWSQGHVTLLVVVPHFNSPVCQLGVAISLVEVKIWYFLIFNVRRRIRLILLQKLQGNFAGFFDIFRITKCGKIILLQSASGITKCDRLLLQSASGIQSVTDFITKCVSYYKVWQLLQSET